jgi:hypothetical protein
MFATIRQYKAACAKASITTGIDAAIRRVCAERDLCVAPLDAILAKIKHCEIFHDIFAMHDEPGLCSMVVCSSDDTTVSDTNNAVITSLLHPPYFLLGCSIIT